MCDKTCLQVMKQLVVSGDDLLHHVPDAAGIRDVAGESGGGGAFPLDDAGRLLGGVAVHIHANNVRAVPREEDSCSLSVAHPGPTEPAPNTIAILTCKRLITRPSQCATAGQARRG
jgi:hypothetical protein